MCGNISLNSKKTFMGVVCVCAFVHILLSNKHKHVYVQMHNYDLFLYGEREFERKLEKIEIKVWMIELTWTVKCRNSGTELK